MNNDTVIAIIPKNAREEIRVFLTSFQGHDLCGLRVFYDPQDGGEWRPGKSGINVRLQQLPDIIEALQQAHSAATGAE